MLDTKFWFALFTNHEIISDVLDERVLCIPARPSDIVVIEGIEILMDDGSNMHEKDIYIYIYKYYLMVVLLSLAWPLKLNWCSTTLSLA